VQVSGWVVAVVAVVAGVALLVLVDRLVARGLLDRRRPRRPRDASGGGSAGGGLVGDLIDVFQPSRTHTTDELERRRHDRQDAGDGAPPVDLDAGTARVDAAPARHAGDAAPARHAGDGPGPAPGVRTAARP
jgi:hypothetical protein